MRLERLNKGSSSSPPTTSHHVSAQVDAEDGDSSQRKRNARNDEEEEGRDLWDVTGQGVRDGLLQVVKDETACSETETHESKMGPCTDARFVYIDILLIPGICE